MKKIIVSLLFIGSCLVTKAQLDTCNIDYCNMFSMDSIYSKYYGGDEMYGYFSNSIFKRYEVKLREIYNVDQLIISFEDEGWFKISSFMIESPKYGILYFNPCQMEELLK